MAKSTSTTPGQPVDEGEATPAATVAELEQDIQNDPNLPAGMFARVRSDPQYLEELVAKKRKGEPLYDSAGEGETNEGEGETGEPKGETTKPKGETNEGEGGTVDDEGEEGEGKKKKKRRSGYLRAAERALDERDSLARENEELRRKLAERPAAGPPDTGFGEAGEPKPAAKKKVVPKPKEDDYESYTEFMEALSDWTVEKRVSEAMAKRDKADRTRTARDENVQAASRLDQALTDQATAAEEKHEDWQEVVEQVDEHMAAEGLEWPDSHMVAFATTGRAGEIAYYLGQNLDECEKLVKAKSRDALMVKLGKIEAKIDAEEPADAAGDAIPKKEVPKPMKKHLGGTTTATVKDEQYYADDASPKEYADRELRRMGLVK